MAVRNDKTRVKAPSTVDLVSPNGTEVTVSEDRAEALLKRVPIQRGDGSWHKYARVGESTAVDGDSANKAIAQSLKGTATPGDKGGDK